MSVTHWEAWHDAYRYPESRISQRLRVVQGRIRRVLNAAPPGTIRIVSACAGNGRDLLGVLADHPRRFDVSARLIELDPQLADRARASAAAAGLSGIDVLTGDAALIDNYANYAPANLVLTCGVFGNISDEDVEATIDSHQSMCAHDAIVIWTRHRRAPDLVPQICAWFGSRGFELEFVSDVNLPYGIGVHRYAGHPRDITSGLHMFTFR